MSDLVVKTIAWSAPISAALVTLLFFLLRTWFTERLKGSVRHEYDKQLEMYKTLGQRLNHVNTAQFDLELANAQKLWAAVSSMVELTAQVLRHYNLTENETGKGIKKQIASQADDATVIVHRATQELRPFLPLEIIELARALFQTCVRHIHLARHHISLEYKNDPSYNQQEMSREVVGSIAELNQSWERLADAIRDRLAALANEPAS